MDISTPLIGKIGLQAKDHAALSGLGWHGPVESIAFDETGILEKLQNLDLPVFIVRSLDRVGITNGGAFQLNGSEKTDPTLLASSAPFSASMLGDPSFQSTYNVRMAYYAGAMANAISSAEMVIALGKDGLLGSFGAAGMVPLRLEEAIQRIQTALPNGPYAFNLIHSPNEPAMEHRAVDLYLKYGVTTLEASAFLDLTASLVYYRLAGLSLSPSGSIQVKNHIIAKISRKEVATRFMQPAPADLIQQLLAEGKITPQQASLAQYVPMADDITVEADSGGHTDNRPLVCLVPTMVALRDELQEKYKFQTAVRIGAAGGVSTPTSALAAFMMGAAYIGTGSINQACLESGASEHTKKLLAQASMADVMMAPSADMFEMGVKVQVLKLGTLFPMRASKLYEIYTRYNSIDEIPTAEREKVEKQIFRREMESIWQDTVKFFNDRDPGQIVRAESNPHHKMALIFRWYLGLSSRWSNSGEKGREMDYQIWCGPSMGSFNDWTRGTYLADPQNRLVVDTARHMMNGCAYQYRTQLLKSQGVQLSPRLEFYKPEKTSL